MRAKIMVVAGLLVLALLGGARLASAQGVRSGPHATVKNDETVQSSVYAAGSTVDIAGTVEGDVFCAGQNVTVSGTVDGDVICAGQNVTISGTVKGDVRAAGQTLTLSGSVGGSATLAGQTVTLSSGNTISRDVTLAGAEIIMSGQIGRDVMVGSGDITIEGSIGRNMTAQTEKLRLSSAAKVGGNLEYTSPSTAVIDSKAQVLGNVSHSLPPAETQRRSNAVGMGLTAVVIMTVALLAVSLTLILLIPQFIDRTAQQALREPLKTVGVGIVFLIFAPVVVLVLMLSIIGIPLALLALLGWATVLMLSGPFYAYTLGKAVWRQQTSAILIMIVGSLLVLLSYMIPIVQVISLLAAGVWGSGMVMLSAKRRLHRPNYMVSPRAAK